MSSTPQPSGPMGSQEEQEIGDQIEAVRADVQRLTSSVSQLASSQVGQLQESMIQAIRRNPFAAIAIAAGVGFLYGVIRR